MNAFNMRTAIRIAAVSVLLAGISSPIAWFVSLENEEESIVSLAMEESRHLLDFNQAVAFADDDDDDAAAPPFFDFF